MTRIAIVEAPSDLGLKPTGVRGLAARLLDEGLAERLGARRAARLEPPPWTGDRDPARGVLHADAIARFSPALADAVTDVLQRGELPLVLGGDCSILLGTLLALRRRGRHGLLFLDGHADYYQPEAEPTGEVASMELALATGSGPAVLANLEGRTPLVRAADVVALGVRDGDEQRREGSQPLPDELLALDLEAVRRRGVEQATTAALDRLVRDDLEGFAIHVDADCLDDAVMPAVDYRLPGGLRVEELVAVLRAAVASGRAVAVEVTIYNPALDVDGSAGRTLTHALAAGLGPAATA